jgi:hypothetical protein
MLRQQETMRADPGVILDTRQVWKQYPAQRTHCFDAPIDHAIVVARFDSP